MQPQAPDSNFSTGDRYKGKSNRSVGKVGVMNIKENSRATDQSDPSANLSKEDSNRRQ